MIYTKFVVCLCLKYCALISAGKGSEKGTKHD